MSDVEHTRYRCPVHGFTDRVVHGEVPFCVDGDCARGVEVIEYVPADQLRGAVEENERLRAALREIKRVAAVEAPPVSDEVPAKVWRIAFLALGGMNPSESGESEHAERGPKAIYPKPESFGEATGGK